MYKRYECPNCDFYEIARYDLHREKCPACGHRYHVFEEEIEDERYSWLFDIVKNHFSFENFIIRKDSFLFIGSMISDFATIKKAFEDMKYYPFIREKNGRVYLHLFKAREKGKSRKVLPIVLLVATIASVFYAGFSWAGPMKEMGYINNTWLTSLAFMVGLITILGCHEMGHKITAIKNNIDASWPHFIPLPISPIGTMGAVISIKSPIPTKKAAIRLGLSGPVVGFVLSIVVLSIGMMISPVVPTAEYAEAAEAFDTAHPEGYSVGFGNTLTFMILRELLVDVPQGYTWVMHPLVIAGIIGIFVTALNLIPMGQLDGGHIARSILGERYHMVLSKSISFGLLGVGLAGRFLGYHVWIGWIIWGFVGYFMASRGHPGAMDEVTPLTSENKLLALIGILIFILCFTPTPIYVIP
ncbi:MAG: site-2 protease family protein [Euryarchaeota archaeon]|nr:site-2 protease family protein [Euryarchaeota archaeon]